MSLEPRQLLKAPVLTERTTALRSKYNEYVFRVDVKASKPTIKQAVEQLFKVKVQEVRTMRMPGKRKRMGRYEGHSASWKKAIVRLKKDQTIPIFDNV